MRSPLGLAFFKKDRHDIDLQLQRGWERYLVRERRPRSRLTHAQPRFFDRDDFRHWRLAVEDRNALASTHNAQVLAETRLQLSYACLFHGHIIRSHEGVFSRSDGAGRRRSDRARPNPITGSFVQGPVVTHAPGSFKGYLPLPVRHGMTLGELASLFNRELGSADVKFATTDAKLLFTLLVPPIACSKEQCI